MCPMGSWARVRSRTSSAYTHLLAVARVVRLWYLTFSPLYFPEFPVVRLGPL